MKRKAFMTLISKVYKKTADDLADNDLKLSDENKADDAELDDDEVAKVLTQLDSGKVTELKKTVADATFKKAEAQTAKRIEKKIKETFDVADDVTLEGDDLIDHIKDTLPEGGPSGSDITKLTPEEVLKVPAVKKIVQDHKRAINDLTKKHTDELEAERGKIGESALLSEVAKKAEARLNRDGFKVILPEDAAKKEARVQALLHDKLKGVKWQKDSTGNIVPVDKDGVPLEDANGNALTFETFTDSIIDTNFDFSPVTAAPPQGPNNKNTQQQQQQQKKSTYTGRKPQSKSDYLSLLTGDENNEEQKAALADTYRGHSWE